jgi:hypothetical protein
MKKNALSILEREAPDPAPPSDQRWVTKKQVAVSLGIDPRSVTKLMKEKKIPYIKLFGGKQGDVRFDLPEVKAHLKEKNGIAAAA